MQSSGRVDDDHVRAARLGRAQTVIHHGGRVAPLLMAHDLRTGALGPYGELIGGGSAEGIARAQQHPLSLADKLMGELADRRGLAHAVDADHQDHRRLRLQLQRRVANLQLLAHQLNKALARLMPLAKALFPGQALHALDKLFRRGGADVGEHQKLLQIVVKILVVRRVVLKQRLQLLHVFPGLRQPGENLIEKAHVFIPPRSFARSPDPARSRSTRLFPAW